MNQYFERNYIRIIAIYDGGQVGEYFCKKCVRSFVKALYIIDKFVRGGMQKYIMEIFGKDTKLILTIRNPLDVVYSCFKHEMDATVYYKYDNKVMT